MTQYSIIGAGFAGLTTAFFLNKYGFNVVVFEHKENEADILESGGGITIFPNGMHIFRKMGVADSVVKHGSVIEKAELCDQHGHFFAHHDMGTKEKYGEPTVAIRRKSLYKVLKEEMERIGINIIYGKKLVNLIEKEKLVELHFEQNDIFESEYVIGADGIRSAVRKHVCPHDLELKFANLVYLAGFVNDEKKIETLNLKPKTQHITVGEDSFFAYNKSSTVSSGKPSLIWFTFMKQDSSIGNKNDEYFVNKLKSIQKKWSLPTHALIDMTDTYSKANIYEMNELPNWSTSRTILIGDAAHAMSPMAGQGACTAIEDGEMLGYLCKFHADKPFDLFEKIRRERVTKIALKGERSSMLSRFKVSGVALKVRNKLYSLRQKIIPEKVYNKVYNYKLEDYIKNDKFLI